METRASVAVDYNQSKVNLNMSADLKSALTDIIDYDKLADVLAKSMETVHITAELDSQKSYNDMKTKWNQDFKRLHAAPVPF